MVASSARRDAVAIGVVGALASFSGAVAVLRTSPVGGAATMVLFALLGSTLRSGPRGARRLANHAIPFSVAMAMLAVSDAGVGEPGRATAAWPLVVTLAAYPLLGGVVLAMVESYRRVRRADVVVEGALLGAAAAIAVESAGGTAGLPGTTASLLVGVDVGLAALTARSLVNRDARSGPLGALNLAMLCLLGAHLHRALAPELDVSLTSTALAIAALVCMAGSVVHPRARTEPSGLAREHALFSMSHTAVVVLALVAAPGVLALHAMNRLVASTTVIAGAMAAAAILACYLVDLLRDRATTEHRATHDPLTGLPNRFLFTDRLERAIAHARRNELPVGVLFVDLDGFKAVNDSFGHAAGDGLMRDVAERLLRCRRDEDTVARLAGDEFAIMLPHLAKPGDVVVVAERLLEALREPITVAGERLLVAGSIGIAVFPHDGDSPSAILASADAAMYRAKETGGNGYEMFSEKLATQAHARLRIESALFDGLEREEFILHYQPIFDFATGRISGAEALVRWNHPEDGLLLPGHFVPVAEQSDLVVRLGELVLRDACTELRRWEDLGIDDTTVSVNVSSRHFTHGLVEAVTSALRMTGADPTRLVLELTESTAVDKLDAVVAALEELRSLGVRAAIDDFGTGYCGLRYLGSLPVDYLKIDKSFVQAMTPSAAAIVNATIAMGHSLGLTLVAEGVETPEQRRFLSDRGCDYFQGFLVGKPMPATDLVDLIRAQPPVLAVATRPMTPVTTARTSGDAAADAVVHDLHALVPEMTALPALVGRGERPVPVHDTPPREAVAVLGEESTNGAGRAAPAGAPGHLAVGDDLAGLQPGDHRPERLLQRGHVTGSR